MENAIWNLFDLTDKNAVVTGASGGIGYACAIGLAQAGANVVAHYNTNKKTADKLCSRD